MSQTTIIYSIYTVEDRDYMLDFLGHLNPLLERYNASIWDNDAIPIGDIWRPTNNSRIPNTDLFILFVSHTFMYSEFINQIEFKWIIDSYKEGNCKVIPILIDDCPWEIDFKSEDYNFSFTELQVLPKRQKPITSWRNQNKAFKNIVSEIKRVLANLAEKHNYEAENYEEHNFITNEHVEPLEEESINATVIDGLELIEAEGISATVIEEIAFIEADEILLFKNVEIAKEEDLATSNNVEKDQIIEEEVSGFQEVVEECKDDNTVVIEDEFNYVGELSNEIRIEDTTPILEDIESSDEEEIIPNVEEEIASVEVGKKPRKAHKRIAAEIKRVFAIFTDNNPVKVKNDEDSIPVFEEDKTQKIEDKILSNHVYEDNILDIEENSSEIEQHLGVEEIIAILREKNALKADDLISNEDDKESLNIIENTSNELSLEDEIALIEESKPDLKIVVPAISKEDNITIEEAEPINIVDISSIIEEITAILGEERIPVVANDLSIIEDTENTSVVAEDHASLERNEIIPISKEKSSIIEDQIQSNEVEDVTSNIEEIDSTNVKKEIASKEERNDAIDNETKPRKAHKRIASEIKRLFAIFKENHPVQIQIEEEDNPSEDSDNIIANDDSLPTSNDEAITVIEESVSVTEREEFTSIIVEEEISTDVTEKTKTNEIESIITLDKDELNLEGEEFKTILKETIILPKEEETTRFEEEHDAQILKDINTTTVDKKSTIHTIEQEDLSKEEERIIEEEIIISGKKEDIGLAENKEIEPIVVKVNVTVNEEIKTSEAAESSEIEKKITAKVKEEPIDSEVIAENEPEITVTSDGVIVLKNEIERVDDIEMAFIINEGITSIAKEKKTPVISEEIALLDSAEFVPILEEEIKRIESEINLIKNIVAKKRFNVSRGEWKVEKKSYKYRNTEFRSKILAAVVLMIFCIAAYIYFKEDPIKYGPVTAYESNFTTSESVLLTNLNIGDSYEEGIVFEMDKTKQIGKIVSLEDLGPLSWKNAQNIHEELGEGWRLPTLEELIILHQILGQDGNNSAAFSNELYWSSTIFEKNEASLLRFSDANTSYHYNVNVGNQEFHLRAVKDFIR